MVSTNGNQATSSESVAAGHLGNGAGGFTKPKAKKRKNKPAPSPPFGKEINSQVKPLRLWLNDFLVRLRAYREPGKRQGLIDHVVSVIQNHRNDGLKAYRGLFIQGVRTLGGETPVFEDSLKLDKDGYPIHFGDLFRFLKYAGHANADSNSSLCDDVRIALSVLRWPYCVKLGLTEAQVQAVMDDFTSTVTAPAQDAYASTRVGEMIADWAANRYPPGHAFWEPLAVRLENRTYKGGNPKKRNDIRVPSVLRYIEGMPLQSAYTYAGPVGKVAVLSEKAGKTRTIVSYDGAINSTNFYDKVRSCLNDIEADTSDDQRNGHVQAMVFTANPRSGQTLVSVDLSSFTDELALTALIPLLDRMGARDIGALVQQPIIAGSEVIQPQRALMGLRGTFEVASLLHHGIVAASMLRTKTPARFFHPLGEISSYTMCGDDLLAVCKGVVSARETKACAFLTQYEQMCSYVNLKINRSKTVMSPDTAVFCGRVYHKGIDVSPLTLPCWTITRSKHMFVDAGSHIVERANHFGGHLRDGVYSFMKKQGKYYTGLIPYALPAKLGGLGFLDRRKSLLDLITRKGFRSWCRIPAVEDDESHDYRSLNYAMDVVSIRPRFYWLRSLVMGGGVKRYRKVRPTVSNLRPLPSVFDCLVYYYDLA